MDRFYGTKIKNGTMTIDKVPSKWREETENWLLDNASV